MNALTKKDQELFDTLRIMEELNNGSFEQKFEDVIEHLKQEYLSNSRAWFIAFSGGKDSSLVLHLVWQMLKRLTPLQRTKPVHIVAADTKVETKYMTDFLRKNLKLIKKNSTGLNIKVHLVQPDLKNTFAWNVIGKGYPYPEPKSPFQWCTSKHKIKPMDKKIKELLNKHGKMTMLLGVRLDESTRRAESIKRHSENDFFAKHTQFEDVKVYHPIKYIQTADLWAYLSQYCDLSWGLPYEELFAMYADGKECPIVTSENEKAEACGKSNSRNGCFTCLYSGREDKMLETLIAKGHDEVEYLADFKRFLYDTRNDVRFREPISRKEIQKIAKEDNNIQLDLFSDNDLSDNEISFKYYKRADKTKYNPGGYTFELRLMLLQKLLYAQDGCGYELIDKEELEAIIKEWEKEGYEVMEEDIVPIDHELDGVLCLNPNGTVNEKDTTIQQMAYTIDIKFEMPLDEIADYLKKRQQITGKSYYCFLNYQEYENFHYVNNVLTFIVSKRFIDTKEEAIKALYSFLFPTGEHLPIEIVLENEKAKNELIKLDIMEDLLNKYVQYPQSPEFAFLKDWLFNAEKLTKIYEKSKMRGVQQ